MADEKIRLSQKEVKTFNALKEMGGVHFPVFKDNTNYYKLPLSELEESLSETLSEIEESLGETIEHILDLSILDEENTTFDVVLTANRNNAISFVGSSEQTAIVAIEIEGAKSYHIQIVGACTLEITGIEWWGDAITDITDKSEINIMNGRAIGVLIDV